MDYSEKLIQELQIQLLSSTEKLKVASKENVKLQEEIESVRELLSEAQKDNEKVEEAEKVAKLEIEKLTKDLNESVENLAKFKVKNNQYKFQIDELKERLKLIEPLKTEPDSRKDNPLYPTKHL